MPPVRPPWVGDAEEASVNDLLRQDYDPSSTETLRLSSVASASVDAYIEYRRIVGDADGGVLLSEAEYAAFRERAAERAANRLYVTWSNVGTGLDCKSVGPASLCECGHRYGEHESDSVGDARSGSRVVGAREAAPRAPDLRCLSSRCRCRRFAYLPSAGTWRAKCGCKHAATEHDPATRACTRCDCACLAPTFSCGCGAGWALHSTVAETREQRAARGVQVDNLGGPGASALYAGMGGVTDFSALADGYASYEQGALRRVGMAAEEEAVEGGAGSALSRLKASRAQARSAAAPPSPTPAASFASRRRAEAEAASAAAAQRRAEAAAAEAAAAAELPELEQLHRLTLRKGR